MIPPKGNRPHSYQCRPPVKHAPGMPQSRRKPQEQYAAREQGYAAYHPPIRAYPGPSRARPNDLRRRDILSSAEVRTTQTHEARAYKFFHTSVGPVRQTRGSLAQVTSNFDAGFPQTPTTQLAWPLSRSGHGARSRPGHIPLLGTGTDASLGLLASVHKVPRRRGSSEQAPTWSG